ncbi:IclR family transcriptional regulator [Cognatishimia activa]|uniref:Transcriptional regulator KdgR n=1 Tax=Cognatishimia activa TaxID=1715691 RepID=A0A0P1IM48_9RHOB|nr:IclR family transcriptional regulator [Cognatishimia activa]MEE2946441.1 IclR family transcriptional regulator [Pseudomonadota bacterium]CUI44245.1 Transcriptional regulator KdgR [Cognatishimia activa]CUK24650.1 Transcriptional regulator KdgR [Cognatishimia activa]
MAQTEKKDGTVGKALEILDLVATAGRPIRFSDLLAQSPHPKATLYRFLQTLTNQGMLNYDEERQTYSLGLRLVRFAHAAWGQSSLAPVASRHLDSLAEETGETLHLAQFDNGQVLYVDKRNAAKPVEMFAAAGKVGPAYCTGVGKAMMAYMEGERLERALSQQAYLKYTDATLTSSDALRAELETIRADGFSYDREEHEPGIICIAAPIHSGGGRVIGAISITTTTDRRSLAELDELRPRLLKCATDIGEDAAAWQFPAYN